MGDTLRRLTPAPGSAVSSSASLSGFSTLTGVIELLQNQVQKVPSGRAATETIQRDGNACSLIANRLEDLTWLVKELEISSRDFH